MKNLCIFLILPLCAFGAGSGSGDYDIVPRTINFLIFVAILYYLIATPIKNFFKGRIAKISSRLDEIQKKLSESKAKKLDVLKKLEEAKANATGALESAKKEAELLAEKIKADTKDELLLLEKQFEEQKEYELRKMEKEVISQTLAELFSDESITLKQGEIVDIMMKKVS